MKCFSVIRSGGLLLWLGLAASPITAQPTTRPLNADSLRRILADRRRPDTVRAQAAMLLGAQAPDNATALRFYRQVLALAGPSHSGDLLRLRTLNNVASVQGKTGDLAGSIRTQQELLTQARRLHDAVGQNSALHNMAVCTEMLGDPAGAVKLFRQALAVPGLAPDRRLQTQAAMSQSLLIANPRTGPAEAEALIKRTLTEARAAYTAGTCSKSSYETVAMMAGRTLLACHHPAEAVALAQQELTRLKLFKTTRDLSSADAATAADLHLTVAEGLMDQHAWRAAVPEALDALAMTRRARQPISETDVLPLLVEALEGAHDWRTALRYQQRLTALTDSLTRAARSEEAQRLQVSFATREKEARIRQLAHDANLAHATAVRRQQQLWALGGSLALVLLGAGVGTVLYVRLRHSQQRLQHLTQLKDQLFAIIGHDLRGPVTGFRQVVPLLYAFADEPDPEEQYELARAFDHTSAQLNDLLDNLLHWGQVQTQALTVRAELVDLVALLRAEMAVVQVTAMAKQVAVTVVVAPHLAVVHTDPTLLRVVIRNLLTNAVKYTRAGGTVTLHVGASADGGTTVAVQDTGVGMEARLLTILLADDAKPTVSRSGTAGEQGTGLGLRVARAFARELGAPLTAESAPGRGTTFALVLPVRG